MSYAGALFGNYYGYAHLPPPVAPVNLHVTGTTISSVSLAWNAVAGASSYSVFAGSSSGGENFGSAVATTTGATSVTVTGLAEGQTYYFVVIAYNPSAGGGPVSNEVSGITMTVNVYTLASGVGATGPQTGVNMPQTTKSFQADIASGTGSATILIQASMDNVNWNTIATLTPSNTASDIVSIPASAFLYYRTNATALSGGCTYTVLGGA